MTRKILASIQTTWFKPVYAQIERSILLPSFRDLGTVLIGHPWSFDAPYRQIDLVEPQNLSTNDLISFSPAPGGFDLTSLESPPVAPKKLVDLLSCQVSIFAVPTLISWLLMRRPDLPAVKRPRLHHEGLTGRPYFGQQRRVACQPGRSSQRWRSKYTNTDQVYSVNDCSVNANSLELYAISLRI